MGKKIISAALLLMSALLLISCNESEIGVFYGLSREEFIEEQDAAAIEQYAKTQRILSFIVDNAVITEEKAEN